MIRIQLHPIGSDPTDFLFKSEAELSEWLNTSGDEVENDIWDDAFKIGGMGHDDGVYLVCEILPTEFKEWESPDDIHISVVSDFHDAIWLVSEGIEDMEDTEGFLGMCIQQYETWESAYSAALLFRDGSKKFK